jgi:hypothetical protein
MHWEVDSASNFMQSLNDRMEFGEGLIMVTCVKYIFLYFGTK